MTITFHRALLAGATAFALASCGSSPDRAPSDGPATAAAPEVPIPTPDPSVPPMVSPIAGATDTAPTDAALPPLTADARKGEQGARNVLLTFAHAIEMQQFDRAWSMLGKDARNGWSKAGFEKTFAGLERITVAVPEGQLEGAAGSLYYTSQATITARDDAGRPVRIEGPITLRRVNDVPGASAEELRWHISRLKLDVTH